MGPAWRPHADRDGAFDPHGPREVLHSRARHAVRVGGREYAFPPVGRTLVLLVDDQPTSAAGVPSVMVHAVTVRRQPRADAIRTVPKVERLETRS